MIEGCWAHAPPHEREEQCRRNRPQAHRAAREAASAASSRQEQLEQLRGKAAEKVGEAVADVVGGKQ